MSKKIDNNERVLGRTLSQEQATQVAGGVANAQQTSSDPNTDSNNGGITTISRDSGVWGEGCTPYK